MMTTRARPSARDQAINRTRTTLPGRGLGWNSDASAVSAPASPNRDEGRDRLSVAWRHVMAQAVVHVDH